MFHVKHGNLLINSGVTVRCTGVFMFHVKHWDSPVASLPGGSIPVIMQQFLFGIICAFFGKYAKEAISRQKRMNSRTIRRIL